MIGSKWLSEILDLSNEMTRNRFKEGKLNLIVAPCGCGKTRFATRELPKLVSKPFKMVYLIDTTMGKKQLLKEPNITYYDTTWHQAVCDEFVIYDNDSIVCMTYYYFGRLIKNNRSFADQFELILCDEIHNSIYFGNIPTLEEVQYTQLAQKEIAALINRNSKVKVIGLTATPQILVKYGCPQNMILTETEARSLKRYTVNHRLYFGNVKNLMNDLDMDKIGIIYTPHVKIMKRIIEIANAKGFHAAAVWSLTSKEHKMDKEQLRIRQYIIDNEELPPEYNLIVINGSCGTGINIRSHVDYMVINTVSSDIIIQARGRVRHDLDVLFIRDNSVEDIISIEIPSAFIGLPLYRKEKDLLCELFPIWDSKGRLTKWPTLKKHIQEAGYTVNTLQDKYRKSYDIINA